MHQMTNRDNSGEKYGTPPKKKWKIRKKVFFFIDPQMKLKLNLHILWIVLHSIKTIVFHFHCIEVNLK